MIGFIMICNAAVYIVFPLSFTSLSDLSAPSSLDPLYFDADSIWSKQLLFQTKSHRVEAARLSSLCVSLHLLLYFSLPTALGTEVPFACAPTHTHTPYSVLSLKRRSQRPQEHTKGCFCTIMSLAIPDAQAPWLDKPLDIGGAPAMVDFAYADFMLTTINLTNTSLFSSVATPQHVFPSTKHRQPLACQFS